MERRFSIFLILLFVGTTEFGFSQIVSSARSQNRAKSLKRLPDPRYRIPMGEWEIDHVASVVARTTGRRISGTIVVSLDSPIARIVGPLESGEIRIHPKAAKSIPPNSWAFIIGHEFAHRTHGLGSHGRTNPELEFQADVVGAEFAIRAGFDLAAHIAWTLSRPRDRWTPTHGSLHQRTQRLGRHFQIPHESVQRQFSRYRNL